MIFLTVKSVEALQRRTIDLHGGMHGLRDRGLLESAVARAENTAYYNPEATVAEVAASLAWGLIKNHAFFDGNKRIGYAALSTFLDVNGFELVCSEEEESAAVLRVASGDMSESDWTGWVARSVGPI